MTAKKQENIDLRLIDNDPRAFRIYLDGVYDLTHYGHFRLFKQIRDKFPNAHIIAGICSDADTSNYKGQTLLSQNERAESCFHCKWVDEVICPAPWTITEEYMLEHKIDYVAHDGEIYPVLGSDGTVADDVYTMIKRTGRFMATQRADGISTTDLINRIVRRYNEFVLRNLKRGKTRHDLKISLLKELRIVTNEKSQRLKENVKNWMTNPQKIKHDFLILFDRQIVQLPSSAQSENGSESDSSTSVEENHNHQQIEYVTSPPRIFKFAVTVSLMATAIFIVVRQHRQ